MITEQEQNATLLSATNKDYYSIWQELLETAGKISERWVPESTNESDPGVVLLKVLTACADKLNYNIDKNILEAFMPSAAQTESMRKLCAMMGYQMKYYQAATTNVTVSYIAPVEDFIEGEIYSGKLTIPAWTKFTDVDNSISYISTETKEFTAFSTTVSVPCIEGTIKECEEENDGVVSISNIDDNFRYYLPLTTVAENGIFINNIVEDSSVLGDSWELKSNLNAESLTKKYFAFGYDSKERLPYIQFPEDVSSLIEDGLSIRYIETNGINGNISAKTISTFELPKEWGSSASSSLNTTSKEHALDEFTVYNPVAATNGANAESIDEAYKNFTKTVGTFDTLITCRDYMNKIYSLTVSSTDTTNLVSNVVVSDIRDDINKSITICSFNEFGINYVDKPLTYTKDRTVTTTGNQEVVFKESYNAIDNFQLVLYPFTPVHGLNTKTEFKNSFVYDSSNYNSICSELEDSKTISHNIILPENENSNYEGLADIVAIKNYLRLNAKITTTQKINSTEYGYVLENIKTALYRDFNSRKLDFGEAIPFDSILTCIENADVRIKNVSLDNPTLLTKFELADGEDYYVGSTSDDNRAVAKQIYNKLALRNILAGRIALFNYDTEFTPSITESAVSILPPTGEGSYTIKYLKPLLTIANIPATSGANTIKLKANQIVQFRAPNFKTIVTYPAYVNYYINLNSGSDTKAVPATFKSLHNYMTYNDGAKFKDFMDTTYKTEELTSLTEAAAKTYITNYGYVFTRSETDGYYSYTPASTVTSGTVYYGVELKDLAWAKLSEWIKTQVDGNPGIKLSGLYKSLGYDATRVIGKMVDASRVKYQLCNVYQASSTSPFYFYFVQKTYNDESDDHTKDGFGKDAIYKGISADEEYKLDNDEYLCINYTSSTTTGATTESGEATTSTESSVVNAYYGPGTIIKPNMDLIASHSKRNQGTSYSKTSGYEFKDHLSDNPAGMYSLGANEQIEIRKQANTLIYDNTADIGAVNIYFKLNNEPTSGTITLAENNNSYTLGEGEYFWVSNREKTTLNYYGNGSVIANHTGRAIVKSADTVSTEKLLEEGLDVIPWIKLTGLTYDEKEATNNKYIQIDEYQYMTLIASDELSCATVSGKELDHTWKAVSDVEFICDGVAGTLPKISVGETSWKGRTKLAVNSGPATLQTLENGEYYAEGPTFTEQIGVYSTYPSSEASAKITISGEAPANSFKTNYALNSSEDIIQTFYSLDGAETDIDDFTIKVLKNNDIYIKENDSTKKELLNIGNMSTYFTSFAFSDGALNEKYTTFDCALSKTNQYALLMIYYSSKNSALNDLAYLQVSKPDTAAAEPSAPVIFNNWNNSTECWWPEYTVSGTPMSYKLKPNSLNVIKFSSNTKVTIFCGKDNDDSVIISPLRLVNYTAADAGLNLSTIGYYGLGSSTAAAQLLSDINKKDPNHEFLYNAVLDSSLELNINTYADPMETLATPEVWYDYNNINNKFVISEIDADYLDTGITLAKTSSKLL